MNHRYTLDGSYLVASPKITNGALEGALVYIYQVEDGVASGLVINKPHRENKTLGDFLAYPTSVKDRPIWVGGPLTQERVIAFYQKGTDVYITDRLAKMTEEQLAQSLFLSGQCVWSVDQLVEQIRSGDWLLVGSNLFIPNHLPAEMRVDYLLSAQGIKPGRYVAQGALETT